MLWFTYEYKIQTKEIIKIEICNGTQDQSTDGIDYVMKGIKKAEESKRIYGE